MGQKEVSNVKWFPLTENSPRNFFWQKEIRLLYGFLVQKEVYYRNFKNLSYESSNSKSIYFSQKEKWKYLIKILGLLVLDTSQNQCICFKIHTDNILFQRLITLWQMLLLSLIMTTELLYFLFLKKHWG